MTGLSATSGSHRNPCPSQKQAGNVKRVGDPGSLQTQPTQGGRQRHPASQASGYRAGTTHGGNVRGRGPLRRCRPIERRGCPVQSQRRARPRGAGPRRGIRGVIGRRAGAEPDLQCGQGRSRCRRPSRGGDGGGSSGGGDGPRDDDGR